MQRYFAKDKDNNYLILDKIFKRGMWEKVSLR